MWQWVRVGDARPVSLTCVQMEVGFLRCWLMHGRMCFLSLKGVAFQQQQAGETPGSWLLILFPHEKNQTDAVNWTGNIKDEPGAQHNLTLKDLLESENTLKVRNSAYIHAFRNQYIMCQWLIVIQRGQEFLNGGWERRHRWKGSDGEGQKALSFQRLNWV